MIDKICNLILKRIRKEMPEVDDERAEVINYGLQMIIGEVPKLLATLLIAYLLGVLKLTLLSYFSANKSSEASTFLSFNDFLICKMLKTLKAIKVNANNISLTPIPVLYSIPNVELLIPTILELYKAPIIPINIPPKEAANVDSLSIFNFEQIAIINGTIAKMTKYSLATLVKTAITNDVAVAKIISFPVNFLARKSVIC